MRHWLMKTEPDTFSFDDLLKLPRRKTSWEGVRNYTARNTMRDDMKIGDKVLFYHSSCAEPGVFGLAEVVKESHPDLSALNPKSEYFDEKSAKAGASRWMMVDVRGTHRLKKPVSLTSMRSVKGLEGMMLLQRGSRLSVQPVTPKEWDVIVKLGVAEALK